MIGGNGFLALPYHCVVHDKYFIVSHTNEHCINVFDRKGIDILCTNLDIGERNRKFEFSRHGCLSVSKAGHLMVCDVR